MLKTTRLWRLKIKCQRPPQNILVRNIRSLQILFNMQLMIHGSILDEFNNGAVFSFFPAPTEKHSELATGLIQQCCKSVRDRGCSELFTTLN